MTDKKPPHADDAAMTTDRWRRVQQVFDAVADLAAVDRQPKLDELTQGDANLRAEVESLLTHDTSEHLPSLRATELQPLYSLGSLVGVDEGTDGRYRLLFPLAINRHSEVWCGEQLDPTTGGAETSGKDATKVAIKFLRNDASDARRLDRFRTEAALLAKFRHPNIAEFIESGCTLDGVPFIVTRFIPGQPITEYADNEQLTIPQRIDLMIRVCDAVGYAHRFLVVHRDLKPSNILVTESGQPVIIDFGISKELPPPNSQSNATTTHDRPMTPAYASPEQVHGEAITTATDVHALGLLLYETMTGHHPFSTAPHNETLPLFDRISQSMPEKPSDVILRPARPLGDVGDRESNARVLAGLRGGSPNQIRRQLKRGLDQVIHHALQKSPDARYHAVADLRNDLLNIQKHRPVSVRSRGPSLHNSIQSRPRTWLGLSLAAGGIVAALITSLWWQNEYLQATNSADSATRELQQARETLEQHTADHENLRNAVDVALASRGDVAYPPDALASLSPKFRATLARNAVLDGKPSLARSLLGDRDNFSNQSLTVKIDAAAAYQQLGLPTNGLAVLDQYGVDPPVASIVRILDDCEKPNQNAAQHAIALDFARTLIPLLQDAGRHNEAYDAEERVSVRLADADNDPQFQLISAAARHEIRWEDGFQDRIDWLANRSNTVGLSEDQLWQFALLKARVASDLEQPQAKELLQEIIDNVDGRSPQSFRVRGEALLLLAEMERESADFSKAESRLREIMDLAEREGLPDHRLTIKAMYALSKILEQPVGNEPVRNEWLAQSWNTAVSAGELGTSTALVIADDMVYGRDANYVYEIVTAIEPYRNGLRSRRYLYRSILKTECRAAMNKSDDARSLKRCREFRDLELELWGKDSIEYAYALACLGHSLEESAPVEAKQTLAQVRNLVESISTNAELPPAVAFLQPIVQFGESDKSKPIYRWIELYNEHNRNAATTQFEMLDYVASTLAKDFPKDHIILSQATKTQRSK